MPATQVRTQQIGDGTVGRVDLNTTVSGSAVIAKMAQPANGAIVLSSTGADAGTGDVTPSLNAGSEFTIISNTLALANAAITYAKIQNVSANTVLARANSAAGAVGEVSIPSSTVLGRAGLGDIAALSMSSPVQISGTAIGLNVGVDFAWTVAQTITLNDANTNVDSSVLRLKHNSSGTPVAGFGSTLWFSAESNTTVDRDQGQLFTAWSNATDGSRASYMGFRTVAAASMTEKMRLWGSGAFHVGGTGIGTDPNADGVINAATGYRVANAAALGNVLTGDATNFVSKGRASSQQAAGGATAGTVSTTGVMAGLAASITPTGTGRVFVCVSGWGKSSVAGAFYTVATIRHGTGTAPAHGAALTGTTDNCGQAFGTSSTAAYALPFCVTTVITGLTVGTTYWIDVGYASSSSGSTAILSNCAVSVFEF